MEKASSSLLQQLPETGDKNAATIPPQVSAMAEKVSNDRLEDTQNASSFEIEGNESPRDMSPLAWFFVSFSVICATFLFSLDTTIVADLQPALVRDLGEIQKLPWISVSFAASATGTCLLWYVLDDGAHDKWSADEIFVLQGQAIRSLQHQSPIYHFRDSIRGGLGSLRSGLQHECTDYRSCYLWCWGNGHIHWDNKHLVCIYDHL